MVQWDYKKHNRVVNEVFGNESQYWDSRPPEKIELALQKYFDRTDLKLVEVIEYCNQATGYPCWRFDYCLLNEKKGKV